MNILNLIRRHLILTLIGVGVLASVIFSSTGPVTQQEVSIPNLKIKQAREMGYEVAVKIPLKSPSTAEYGRVDVEQVATNIYKVSGYIDSQNGFGAMIRSYWQAKLTYSGEDTQQGVESVSNWKMSGLKVE
jgi:hypothetical protein